jgi:hypothetical protein
MLRAFGAFLLVFTLLGLVVHISAVVELFGVAAVALFGIDLAVTHFAKNANVLKAPEDLLQ